MKAYALDTADKPASVMHLPKPEIGDEGVLVAVKAASLNGFDVYQANGYLLSMMPHAMPTVVGRDFAGVVEAVGSKVTEFAAGDEVFGFIPAVPPLKSGSLAEYVAGGPELVLAHKPAHLDFNEAAALPLVGAAALDLLDAIDAKAGDVVLIIGATGGVGSLAVQIAAHRGVVVIATARPEEEAYVRGLGASEIVDYSTGSIADAVRKSHPDGVDALIDVVNRGDAIAAVTPLVRSGGHVASLMGAAAAETLAADGLTGHNIMASPTRDKLHELADLAGAGHLRVPIQGIYTIDRTGEALAAFQAGTRGKLVVSM
jgi:NADPH:quinone reductase-like Zn-dependent oxidoreductase